MRKAGRHYDAFALMQDVGDAIHGKAASALQHLHHGITAGDMGADLLTLFEGKQGKADGVILGQRFADHLAGLVIDLGSQSHPLVLGDIFHTAHRARSFIYWVIFLL